MEVKFNDIFEAFDLVSCSPMFEQQAFVNKETGKIYWHSDLVDDEEKLPADIDDKKYLEIPHKKELGLGKGLVLDFAYEYLPEDASKINRIFRSKGAYSKFKTILERKDCLISGMNLS